MGLPTNSNFDLPAIARTATGGWVTAAWLSEEKIGGSPGEIKGVFSRHQAGVHLAILLSATATVNKGA